MTIEQQVCSLELAKKLKELVSHKFGNEWYCVDRERTRDFIADSESDARAKMLIYLIESKLITL